jgi:hypothetical protein
MVGVEWRRAINVYLGENVASGSSVPYKVGWIVLEGDVQTRDDYRRDAYRWGIYACNLDIR